jgi:hypothetical protein
MDILGTMPVWLQFVIVVLVAAVLIFMNLGWLLQARSWLARQSKGHTPGTMPGSRPDGAARKRDSV